MADNKYIFSGSADRPPAKKRRRRSKHDELVVEDEEDEGDDLMSPELAAGGFAFTTEVPESMNLFQRLGCSPSLQVGAGSSGCRIGLLFV